MKEFTKEEAYDHVSQQLALCTVEDAKHSAVILIIDDVKSTVKVYGLNIDENELPMLLVEAAANTAETLSNLTKNRTIQ